MIQNRQFRLQECNQNFTSPQAAEILYLFRFMVPASGDAHKNFHSPLAGIRSGIDNSACGDAIKILHSRERSFCNNFAEMHIKIYIPPSREYDPESTVPFAGMQSKFYIPASGVLYLFRFMVPSSGDAHKNFHSPSREYDPESTVPFARMQSKFTSPQAEIL